MPPRRESQKDWYQSRGMIRANQPCPGSGQPPIQITIMGTLTGNGSRVTGTLSRGLCSVCGDELSLNPTSNNQVMLVRKHKDPNAPYKKQILISENTFNLAYKESLRRGLDLDDTVDVLIQEILTPEESQID
jgi:hypothetical protein